MYIELLRVPAMRKKYGYKMSLLRGVCPAESALVRTRHLVQVHRLSCLLLSIAIVTQIWGSSGLQTYLHEDSVAIMLLEHALVVGNTVFSEDEATTAVC